MMLPEKIDTHVHACLERTQKEDTPWNPLANYMADPDEISAHLRSQGIRHAILMSGGPHGNAHFCGDAQCKAIADASQGFFSWMCNPADAPEEDILPLMKSAREQGAIGVGEVVRNEWLDAPRLRAVCSAAQQLGLPVTFHMSPEPGIGYGVCDRPRLPLLEQMLGDYSQLIFVGHSQVFWREISSDAPDDPESRGQMGQGPVVAPGRIAILMERFPNLYADLSAYSASCAILRDTAHGLAFLEKFQDRLFFATDTTNRHDCFPLGRFLDDSLAEGILSRQAYSKICYENAERIYGL